MILCYDFFGIFLRDHECTVLNGTYKGIKIVSKFTVMKIFASKLQLFKIWLIKYHQSGDFFFGEFQNFVLKTRRI